MSFFLIGKICALGHCFKKNIPVREYFSDREVAIGTIFLIGNFEADRTLHGFPSPGSANFSHPNPSRGFNGASIRGMERDGHGTARSRSGSRFAGTPIALAWLQAEGRVRVSRMNTIPRRAPLNANRRKANGRSVDPAPGRGPTRRLRRPDPSDGSQAAAANGNPAVTGELHSWAAPTQPSRRTQIAAGRGRPRRREFVSQAHHASADSAVGSAERPHTTRTGAGIGIERNGRIGPVPCRRQR